MADRMVAPTPRDDDETFDLSLRPKRLSEYIGQERLKENLRIFVEAAKARGEPLDHLLLYGPPGLGKTTLATILANEMEVQVRITSGPAILIPGELAAILTSLQPGDVLFIDEIHRLSRVVEETLYPAMEDFALDMVLGKGMAAKSLRLRLPRFTVIGATTRYAMLSSPLRDRFGATYRLDYYDQAALEQIVMRAARILGIAVEPDGASEIALRSRGTPRLANRLLRRVRDYAEVRGDGRVTREIACDALQMLDIDARGLDAIDRRLLRALIEKYDGGPVGLGTLAAAISEEVDTVEEVYEPYLMQLGMLARTPRGRVATRQAYEHLRLPVPKRISADPEQPRLFE